MKERKRYILFKITPKCGEKKEIIEQVTKACLQFLGQLGMAKAGFQILPETWNTSNQTAIARVGHKYVDEAKSALAFVKEINKKNIAIECLRVSGSLSKLK